MNFNQSTQSQSEKNSIFNENLVEDRRFNENKIALKYSNGEESLKNAPALLVAKDNGNKPTVSNANPLYWYNRFENSSINDVSGMVSGRYKVHDKLEQTCDVQQNESIDEYKSSVATNLNASSYLTTNSNSHNSTINNLLRSSNNSSIWSNERSSTSSHTGIGLDFSNSSTDIPDSVLIDRRRTELNLRGLSSNNNYVINKEIQESTPNTSVANYDIWNNSENTDLNNSSSDLTSEYIYVMSDQNNGIWMLNSDNSLTEVKSFTDNKMIAENLTLSSEQNHVMHPLENNNNLSTDEVQTDNVADNQLILSEQGGYFQLLNNNNNLLKLEEQKPLGMSTDNFIVLTDQNSFLQTLNYDNNLSAYNSSLESQNSDGLLTENLIIFSDEDNFFQALQNNNNLAENNMQQNGFNLETQNVSVWPWETNDLSANRVPNQNGFETENLFILADQDGFFLPLQNENNFSENNGETAVEKEMKIEKQIVSAWPLEEDIILSTDSAANATGLVGETMYAFKEQDPLFWSVKNDSSESKDFALQSNTFVEFPSDNNSSSSLEMVREWMENSNFNNNNSLSLKNENLSDSKTFVTENVLSDDYVPDKKVNTTFALMDNTTGNLIGTATEFEFNLPSPSNFDNPEAELKVLEFLESNIKHSTPKPSRDVSIIKNDHRIIKCSHCQKIFDLNKFETHICHYDENHMRCSANATLHHMDKTKEKEEPACVRIMRENKARFRPINRDDLINDNDLKNFHAFKIANIEGSLKRPHAQHECTLCERKFVHASGLQRHMEKHVFDIAPINNFTHGLAGKEYTEIIRVMLECVSCGQIFYSSDNAINHLSVHYSIINFKMSVPDYLKVENENEFDFVEDNEQYPVEEDNSDTFLKEFSVYLNFIETNCILECEFCDCLFNKMSYLLSHTASHSESESRYNCKSCSIKLSTLKESTLHWQTECVFLRESIKMHQAAFNCWQMCNVCEGKFPSKDDLLEHRHEERHFFPRLDQKSNKLVMPCEFCELSFFDEMTYSLHFARKHQKRYKREKDLDKNSFKARQFLCDICGKAYTQSSHLWQHLRFHQGVKPFECPEQNCGRKFTIRPDLNDHIRKCHTGERPFKCVECGKSFMTGSVYYQHRLIHRGERRYECDNCQKRFYRADALKNHQRIHTGEKPFPCLYCTKHFRQRGDRDKHIKARHSHLNENTRMIMQLQKFQLESAEAAKANNEIAEIELEIDAEQLQHIQTLLALD